MPHELGKQFTEHQIQQNVIAAQPDKAGKANFDAAKTGAASPAHHFAIGDIA